MSELTKEWLQQTIAELEEERDAVPGVVNEDAAMALAAMKLALASIEAEPVKRVNADQMHRVCLEANRHLDKYGAMAKEVNKLLGRAAPPAPVSVPDDVSGPLAHAYKELTPTFMRNHIDVFERYGIYPDGSAGIQAMRIALDGMNRRAAMLQGAEPVTTAYKLPDGWVACSERMPSPSTGVIVAAPWQSAPGGYAMKWATNCPGHPDADIDGWIIPGASWSPTHWMPLPAAPQQRG